MEENNIYGEWVRAASRLTTCCNRIVEQPGGLEKLEEKGVSHEVFLRLSEQLIRVGEGLARKVYEKKQPNREDMH